MNIVFSDNHQHKNLCPLTLTRPVSELRWGILTIQETWLNLLQLKTGVQIAYDTETYLHEKYPASLSFDLKLAGNIKPSPQLAEEVKRLKQNQSLYVNGKWVASMGTHPTERIDINLEGILELTRLWQLFQLNHIAFAIDFALITENRSGQMLSATNKHWGKYPVFLEPGAKAEGATFNTEGGAIYIGKEAEVMEGSLIRGPFSLGDHAQVKMAAKIYGATTIGPHCKVGGEISNSLFQGYSNKGHDGFVGNSVIGEWCNFGADSNTSNLKNNYSNLRIYNYHLEGYEDTDVQFCGVLMGDHSKTSINTMINTGSSIGVNANLFGAGFPSKYVPSFAWGENDKYEFEKAMEVAGVVMSRRNVELSKADLSILHHIFLALA